MLLLHKMMQFNKNSYLAKLLHLWIMPNYIITNLMEVKIIIKKNLVRSYYFT